MGDNEEFVTDQHANPAFRNAMENHVPDSSINDPEPTDQTARREYVARVASGFEDWLGPKLKIMIQDQKDGLSSPWNTREADLVMKANINAYSLLLDWGDEMISERNSAHNPNNEGVDDLSEDDGIL